MTGLEPAQLQKKQSKPVVEILDVEKLDAQNPGAAVKRFELKSKAKIVKCDLLIVGGGTGGVAAAIAAGRAGLDVCITEETSWLGGQMTSQGVSALDENYLVESSGASKNYKLFRQSIRDYYKGLGATDGGARFEPHLDPGNCWVSRLAFEPKVAVKLLSQMLEPLLQSSNLRIFMRHAPSALRKSGGRIKAVQAIDLDSGKLTEFRSKFCIDASELGDLLPLAGVDYRTGAESRQETGEDHAPVEANPENVQDFTYPFVVEYCPGEKHIIEKPKHYDEFNERGKFSLLTYRMFENNTVINEDGSQTVYLPFWEYRRLIAKSNFPQSVFPHDLAMINWESNDLRGENIIDKTPALAAERLALGKSLSLGFLYWMQTEMPRDDGGKGYPELKLRPEIMGSFDGLSKYPYIRESRRIKARYTIVERDLTRAANTGARAKAFSDSLGIGHYPIDIHGDQDVPGAGQGTRPFQIPASAFVQNRVRNLLPACKNIGCTHVSNGAYRLHPIEWAIGEAAAALAVESLKRRTDAVRLLKNKQALRCVQDQLVNAGSPVFWFDDLNPEDKDFAAIQFLSISSLLPADPNTLQFRPDQALTRLELAQSLARLLRLPLVQDAAFAPADLDAADSRMPAVMACVLEGLIQLRENFKFDPDGVVSVAELQEIANHKVLRAGPVSLDLSSPLNRRDFAAWLYKVAKNARFFGRH